MDDDKPKNRFIVEFKPPKYNYFFDRNRLIKLISEIKILPRLAGGLNSSLRYEIEVVLPEGCKFKAKWWEKRDAE